MKSVVDRKKIAALFGTFIATGVAQGQMLPPPPGGGTSGRGGRMYYCTTTNTTIANE